MPGSSADSWFQLIAGGCFTALTALGAWLQLQIGWLRDDNRQTETRSSLAIKSLREEFNVRHSDHVRTQGNQHADNRADMQAIRSSIQAHADIAVVERRRIADSLEKLSNRLGEIADRKEVTSLIATMRNDNKPTK